MPVILHDCLWDQHREISKLNALPDGAKPVFAEEHWKKPNQLGLFDMSGNVWEWCADWYGDYPSGPVSNPIGPASGSDCVLRGGSWLGGARGCRVSRRGDFDPGLRSNDGGFRVASSPQ